MDDFDRDLTIRTVLGEARNQGPLGQAAVAAVIRNRVSAGKYGESPADVVLAPHQFEPWQTRRKELLAIPKDSDAYRQAGRIVDAVMGGAPDPTAGATHFANVATVKDRNGGTVGNNTWIDPKNQTAQIGAHTFFAPNGPVQSGALAYAPPPDRGPAMDAISSGTDPSADATTQRLLAIIKQLQQSGQQRQQPQQPSGPSSNPFVALGQGLMSRAGQGGAGGQASGGLGGFGGYNAQAPLRGILGRLLYNGFSGNGWTPDPAAQGGLPSHDTPTADPTMGGYTPPPLPEDNAPMPMARPAGIGTDGDPMALQPGLGSSFAQPAGAPSPLDQEQMGRIGDVQGMGSLSDVFSGLGNFGSIFGFGS